MSLHSFLTASYPSKNKTIFWLSLSLSLAGLYCLPALQQAFSSPYIVQDDARQHIFWMQRFIDPDLFPQDWIANYFQSVAPAGYKAVYQWMSVLGINPFLLHKILPIFLALITTVYCFGVCLQLLPIPMAGFLACLLLNQNLWMQDDIVSGTPVAFVYPLFLAFLYYLLRGSLIGVGSTIALLGLFYPQCMLVATGIAMLRLVSWQNRRWSLSKNRETYKISLVSLGVAGVILGSYAFKSSEFGQVITATEAKQLPAFLPKGWSSFFSDNFTNFWLCGKRSGMIPSEWCVLTDRFFPLPIPPQIFAGLSLQILLKYSTRFPLTQSISKEIILLPQMAFSSLIMFLMAHALIFKLHLPNRYTEHSLRVLMPLAAGVALTVILDAIFYNLKSISSPLEASKNQKILRLSRFGSWGVCFIFFVAIFGYPHLLPLKRFPFPNTRYIGGGFPELYQFFEQQPKDIIIASLAEEANNLPSFAKRSILTGGEGYALPYHPQYYREIQQRTVDLITAQYSKNLSEVKRFIEKYGIDFWLLNDPDLSVEGAGQNRWIQHYQPTASEAINALKNGERPVLSKLTDRCTVWKNQGLTVLQATCILNTNLSDPEF